MDARSDPVTITVAGLQRLIDLLIAGGWTVVGPTLRDQAVSYAEITSVADLPAGVGDAQDAAHYRLQRRDDDALFGHSVPATSWKALLFPPRERILAADQPTDSGPPPGPFALLGVRSCDLHALRILDHVLLERGVVDVRYARRRADAFVVAVSCNEPGGTCFCAGLGTGPEPTSGYDVRLTELLAEPTTGAAHRFVAVAGSDRGGELLARLPGAEPATAVDVEAAADAVRAAANHMGRRLPTQGLREALYAAAEHPRWAEVAARCLACANCTLVCPTCFCTSIEDTSGLTGLPAERTRVWDSCFTGDFSYLHGGSVRSSTAARYRHWLTHKLAAWSDQFGSLGCVGCGRCITWCPAAIDLVAEVAAVRAPRPSPAGAGTEA